MCDIGLYIYMWTCQTHAGLGKNNESSEVLKEGLTWRGACTDVIQSDRVSARQQLHAGLFVSFCDDGVGDGTMWCRLVLFLTPVRSHTHTNEKMAQMSTITATPALNRSPVESVLTLALRKRKERDPSSSWTPTTHTFKSLRRSTGPRREDEESQRRQLGGHKEGKRNEDESTQIACVHKDGRLNGCVGYRALIVSLCALSVTQKTPFVIRRMF